MKQKQVPALIVLFSINRRKKTACQLQVGSAGKSRPKVREATSHWEDIPLGGRFGIFLLPSNVHIFYKERSDFTTF